MSSPPGVSVATLLGSRPGSVRPAARAAGRRRRPRSHHHAARTSRRPASRSPGFTRYLKPGRVLIFGESEIRYLESLDAAGRVASLRPRADARLSVRPASPAASRRRRSSWRSRRARACRCSGPPVATPTAIAKLSSMLEDSLAERTMLHAVLMDVLGLGVLIAGESGIGKSECALDLIVRGHRLVADDTVEVRRRQETILIGTCPELTRYHMELRGLGVINIMELFGIASTRSSKRVELVVQLERWDADARVRAPRARRRVLRDSRPARPADSHAGRAGPQHRHPGRGRGAQPAAARARPSRGARALADRLDRSAAPERACRRPTRTTKSSSPEGRGEWRGRRARRGGRAQEALAAARGEGRGAVEAVGAAASRSSS